MCRAELKAYRLVKKMFRDAEEEGVVWEVWGLVSAIRGPDASGKGALVAKEEFTWPIREALGLMSHPKKEPPGLGEADLPLAGGAYNDGERECLLRTRLEDDLGVQHHFVVSLGSHFLYHIGNALDVLSRALDQEKAEAAEQEQGP